MKGGPRQRCIFPEDPVGSPALNKYPFVKWNRLYQYILSMHILAPRRLNHVHPDGVSTTGALLHFKFLSAFKEKAARERERAEHWGGGREYAAYDQAFANGTPSFRTPFSAQYRSWRDLEDHGLVTRGDWF